MIQQTKQIQMSKRQKKVISNMLNELCSIDKIDANDVVRHKNSIDTDSIFYFINNIHKLLTIYDKRYRANLQLYTNYMKIQIDDDCYNLFCSKCKPIAIKMIRNDIGLEHELTTPIKINIPINNPLDKIVEELNKFTPIVFPAILEAKKWIVHTKSTRLLKFDDKNKIIFVNTASVHGKYDKNKLIQFMDSLTKRINCIVRNANAKFIVKRDENLCDDTDWVVVICDSDILVC